MSEPYYACVVWADESATETVRETRAEAEAWLHDALAAGGGAPVSTVVIPERHRRENRQLGRDRARERRQSAAVAASEHKPADQACIDALSAELDEHGDSPNASD